MSIKNERIQMNSTTSILCPTRGRPSQLRRMINTACARSSSPENLRVLLYVDFDDNSYDDLQFEEFPCIVKVFRGPRVALSMAFNYLACQADTDYLFWSGDDIEFKTSGWEQKLQNALKAFSQELGVSYADDCASYEQVYATIGMVNKIWVNTLGFLFTPHLKDNGVDNWLSDVARRIGRLKYVEDVKIEHLQFRQGKSDFDDTYRDRRADHETYDVLEIFWKLEDQRRRESLLLLRKLGERELPFQARYLIGHVAVQFSKALRNSPEISNRHIYLLSISNWNYIRRILTRFIPFLRFRNF